MSWARKMQCKNQFYKVGIEFWKIFLEFNKNTSDPINELYLSPYLLSSLESLGSLDKVRSTLPRTSSLFLGYENRFRITPLAGCEGYATPHSSSHLTNTSQWTFPILAHLTLTHSHALCLTLLTQSFAATISIFTIAIVKLFHAYILMLKLKMISTIYYALFFGKASYIFWNFLYAMFDVKTCIIHWNDLKVKLKKYLNRFQYLLCQTKPCVSTAKFCWNQNIQSTFTIVLF